MFHQQKELVHPETCIRAGSGHALPRGQKQGGEIFQICIREVGRRSQHQGGQIEHHRHAGRQVAHRLPGGLYRRCHGGTRLLAARKGAELLHLLFTLRKMIVKPIDAIVKDDVLIPFLLQIIVQILLHGD